jgi:tetratricopeptide (TPR) repeat protein
MKAMNPSKPMSKNRFTKLSAILAVIAVSLISVSCKLDPQKAKTKYLAAGENYMKKGKYGDASIEFRNALRLDPRFVDAYYQLAQADLAQREWQGAYASLSKAIELDPGRLDARLDLGRLYFAARQFDRANEEAISVLREEPDNIGARQLLGAALIGQQKPDEALESFTKVTELVPHDALAFINLALVEISLHHYPEAEAHFKQAVTINPQSSQAIIDLANFYYLQGQLPEAQQTLQAGIQTNPDETEIYTDWANILSNAGKLQESDAVLNNLKNHLPKSPEAAMAIGDLYAGKNQTAQALAEYQRGLSISPNNIEIEKRLEELYLNTDRLNDAAQLDAGLTKRAPKDALVAVLHGRLLLAQGKNPDAVIALNAALKNSGDSAQAHYFLGVAYAQAQSLGQANSEFQEAIRLSPGFPLALRDLTEINIAQNHPGEAQAYAKELVQRYPTEAQYRILLGELFIRRAQLPAAEEQLLVAARLAPNDPHAHIDLGRVYSAAKKFPQAETEFKTAAQLDSANSDTLSPYADFLVTRLQTSKALALFQQFIAAHPDNPDAHVKLGALQFQANNQTAASAEFDRALQLDPKNVEAYVQLAALHESKKETDEAIATYQKALALRPNFAPFVTMIGNLYLEKGELDTARQYFSRALEADPHFAVASANMAWVDAQQNKDLDVALGLAQSAKSQMPEVASVSDTLAWVMYKKGNYSGAIPLLQDCVKRSPDSAQFRYHLGLALVAIGEKDSGKTQLQAALLTNKLAPADREQAQNALASAR